MFATSVGVGGRVGAVEDTSQAATARRDIAGPLASLGSSTHVFTGASSDFEIEGGYDFGGVGGWLIARFGVTVRFW